jgi:hypothetical protein
LPSLAPGRIALEIRAFDGAAFRAVGTARFVRGEGGWERREHPA